MKLHIDLNGDVGESYGRWQLGDDTNLLPLLSSANVACGFHAGDPSTLRRTCELAASFGVAVGAQVSYRDMAGFGRRFIDVPAVELRDEVLYQLGALAAFAQIAGTRLVHVKPHGALYNAVVSHEAQAEAIATAVAEFDPDLSVLGMPNSALLARAAEAGLHTMAEAFVDRAYNPDGTLVPRSLPGAVLTNPEKVAARAVDLVLHHRVQAVDGTWLAVEPDSICLHGDTDGAVSLAAAVRSSLIGEEVTIRAGARNPLAVQG